MTAPQGWRWDAACNGLPTDLFYPPLDPDAGPEHPLWTAPRRICQACPVTEQCLADALRLGERTLIHGGMRAGLTPAEQRAKAHSHTRRGHR